MKTPLKLVYLVLGIVFLMLGVIGLIIPVIPGVLFLMAAVYVLSKASKRVKQFTERDPRILEMQQRFDRFGEVHPIDRVRLAGWMALDGVVKGAESVSSGFSRISRNLQRAG